MLLQRFNWVILTTRNRPRRIGLSFCFLYKNKREVCESVIEQGSSMAKAQHLPEPLSFFSRSKEPNDRFSNFYETKIEMAEGRFNSVEHYFQSMKFIDKDHSRFAIGGDLGEKRSTSDSWKRTVSKGRFIKSAGSKSGTKTHRLTLRSDGLDRERAKRKMKEGLRKKFEKEPFRTLLLETQERPLVHIPMMGKTDYWTARFNKTTRVITGENNMGKLLMQVRKELQEKTKNEEEESEESKEKDVNAVTNEKRITNKDNACQVSDTEGHQQQVRKRPYDNSAETKGEQSNKQMQSEEPDAKRKKTELISDDDQTKPL